MVMLAKETAAASYAVALMNNHAHLLLKRGTRGLLTYVRRLLSGYAQYFNRRHRGGLVICFTIGCSLKLKPYKYPWFSLINLAGNTDLRISASFVKSSSGETAVTFLGKT